MNTQNENSESLPPFSCVFDNLPHVTRETIECLIDRLNELLDTSKPNHSQNNGTAEYQQSLLARTVSLYDAVTTAFALNNSNPSFTLSDFLKGIKRRLHIIKNPQILAPIHQARRSNKNRVTADQFINDRTNTILSAWDFLTEDVDGIEDLTEANIGEDAIQLALSQDPLVTLYKNTELSQSIRNLSLQLVELNLGNQESVTNLMEALDHFYDVVFNTGQPNGSPAATEEERRFAIQRIQHLVSQGIISGIAWPEINLENLKALRDGFQKPTFCNSDELNAYIPTLSNQELDTTSKNHFINKLMEVSSERSVKLDMIIALSSPELEIKFTNIDLATINPDLLKKGEEAGRDFHKSLDYFQSILKSSVDTSVLSTINIKAPTLNSFHHLKVSADEGNGPLYLRDPIVQASWKHQVAQVKYTISSEELTLISNATGMDDLRLIVPKLTSKTPPAAMTYQKAINKITTEIEHRNQIQEWWRKPFVRTAHLEAAKSYLEYYQLQNTMLKAPEIRLGGYSHEPGIQRYHSSYLKSSQLREAFSKQVSKLSWFWGTNRALKKLSEQVNQKARHATKLKREFLQTTARKKLKNTSHQNREENSPYQKDSYEIRDNLVKYGRFFEAPSLKRYFDYFPPTLFYSRKEFQALEEKAREHRSINRTIRAISSLRKQANQLIIGPKIGTEKKAIPTGANITAKVEWLKTMIEQEAQKSPNQRDVLSIRGAVTQLNDLGSDLLKSRNNSTLTQGAQLACINLSEALKTTNPSFNHSFNSTEPLALNQIGKLVIQAKTSNKEVKLYGNLFLKYSALLIAVKKEAKELLVNVLNKPAEQLPLAVSKLRKMLQQRPEPCAIANENMAKFTSEHFIQLKANELNAQFERIDQACKTGDPRSIIQTEINQLSEAITKLTDGLATERTRIQEVISTAQETLNAVLYTSNHRTGLCSS